MKITRRQLRNLILREVRMLNEYPPRTWANRESWEDVDPIQQADGSWTDLEGRPWIPRGRPTGSGPSVPTDEYAAEHGYPWRPETDGPSQEEMLREGVDVWHNVETLLLKLKNEADRAIAAMKTKDEATVNKEITRMIKTTGGLQKVMARLKT